MTDLHQLQRERGICSEPDCENPIAGWCATCNAKGPFHAPKWCSLHLSLHQIATDSRHQMLYLYFDQAGSVPDWLSRLVERTLGTPAATRDWPNPPDLAPDRSEE